MQKMNSLFFPSLVLCHMQKHDSRLERVENLPALTHLSSEWSLMLHCVAPGATRRFFFFLPLGFKKNLSDQ